MLARLRIPWACGECSAKYCLRPITKSMAKMAEKNVEVGQYTAFVIRPNGIRNAAENMGCQELLLRIVAGEIRQRRHAFLGDRSIRASRGHPWRIFIVLGSDIPNRRYCSLDEGSKQKGRSTAGEDSAFELSKSRLLVNNCSELLVIMGLEFSSIMLEMPRSLVGLSRWV